MFICIDGFLRPSVPLHRFCCRCETVLPVQGGVYRRLAATTVSEGESAANVAENLKAWKHSHADGKKRRKLQPWRDNAKWETLDKWRGDPDNDELPKWQRESETPKCV